MIKINVKELENNIGKTASLLKALANEQRLKVICVLYYGEKCVGELGVITGLSQSALSQHLARLRREGLVDTRREAQTVFYSLNAVLRDEVLYSGSVLSDENGANSA